MRPGHRAATLLKLRDLQRRAADRALAAEQARLAARQAAAAAAEAQLQAGWRAAHAQALPCDAWAARQRAQLNAATRMCQEAGDMVDRARAETIARRQAHDGAQRIWKAARAAELAADGAREDTTLLELALASRASRT